MREIARKELEEAKERATPRAAKVRASKARTTSTAARATSPEARKEARATSKAKAAKARAKEAKVRASFIRWILAQKSGGKRMQGLAMIGKTSVGMGMVRSVGMRVGMSRRLKDQLERPTPQFHSGARGRERHVLV